MPLFIFRLRPTFEGVNQSWRIGMQTLGMKKMNQTMTTKKRMSSAH